MGAKGWAPRARNESGVKQVCTAWPAALVRGARRIVIGSCNAEVSKTGRGPVTGKRKERRLIGAQYPRHDPVAAAAVHRKELGATEIIQFLDPIPYREVHAAIATEATVSSVTLVRNNLRRPQSVGWHTRRPPAVAR